MPAASPSAERFAECANGLENMSTESSFKIKYFVIKFIISPPFFYCEKTFFFSLNVASQMLAPDDPSIQRRHEADLLLLSTDDPTTGPCHFQ
jgi:hypothetical protein